MALVAVLGHQYFDVLSSNSFSQYSTDRIGRGGLGILANAGWSFVKTVLAILDSLLLPYSLLWSLTEHQL